MKQIIHRGDNWHTSNWGTESFNSIHLAYGYMADDIYTVDSNQQSGIQSIALCKCTRITDTTGVLLVYNIQGSDQLLLYAGLELPYGTQQNHQLLHFTPD